MPSRLPPSEHRANARSASNPFEAVRIATAFLDKALHPDAEEELIDLGKVVHWLLQDPLRDLVAQRPMRAVFPGILYFIFSMNSSTSLAPAL